MSDLVLCPISPEFVEKLRRPGGWVILGPSRLYLQADNVLVCEALTIEDAVSFLDKEDDA